MKRAAFLDRDGVINRAILVDGIPRPPYLISDVVIIEGVLQAIEKLKEHNFVPVVITNQPDVARGLTTRREVDSINAFIGRKAGIEHFYCCFHDDDDQCPCRKPAPGLIKLAAIELALDPLKSILVGDRWRDIAAGQAAGCVNYFIDYSYPERMPNEPYVSVSSLFEATRIIIGEHNA
jgi:D-glycero-D-manno-heptose 1,7-bisphosphate phosphatase